MAKAVRYMQWLFWENQLKTGNNHNMETGTEIIPLRFGSSAMQVAKIVDDMLYLRESVMKSGQNVDDMLYLREQS